MVARHEGMPTAAEGSGADAAARKGSCQLASSNGSARHHTVEEATGLACPIGHPDQRTLVHVLVLQPELSCRPDPPRCERGQEHAPSVRVSPGSLATDWGH